jgi:hypothetical protein
VASTRGTGKSSGILMIDVIGDIIAREGGFVTTG